MTDHDAAAYGDRFAEVYDEWYSFAGDTEAAVALLARLAGTGPALELGIGTGRIALPLCERGIEVHGIDASEAIVSKLRAKSGGADIPVTIGDFADVGVTDKYSLVFVVFSTLFLLESQADQIRCLRNSANHLTGDGLFVVEAYVPSPARFTREQSMDVRYVGTDRLVLDAARHDPVQQHIMLQSVLLTAAGVRLYPVRMRYIWPSELDLMAQLAGLRLRERWSGWRGEPFTAWSIRHVSIYERHSAP